MGVWFKMKLIGRERIQDEKTFEIPSKISRIRQRTSQICVCRHQQDFSECCFAKFPRRTWEGFWINRLFDHTPSLWVKRDECQPTRETKRHGFPSSSAKRVWSVGRKKSWNLLTQANSQSWRTIASLWRMISPTKPTNLKKRTRALIFTIPFSREGRCHGQGEQEAGSRNGRNRVAPYALG